MIEIPQHEVERMYVTEENIHLFSFACALLLQWTVHQCKGLRSAKTKELWLERQFPGGSADVAAAILSVLGERSVGFIDNLFPYDGIMPEGSNLLHTCLWSVTTPLSNLEINHYIALKYQSKPALVFVNNLERKSVKEIWHAHVVVDMNGQLQYNPT